MHELSLINALLDIVDLYDRKEGFARVNSLKLSFGRLSGIDPGALKFAFEIQSQGTKAAGADLEFDIRPVVVYCLRCERQHTLELYQYPESCPDCLGGSIVMTNGTESLQLLEMDVD